MYLSKQWDCFFSQCTQAFQKHYLISWCFMPSTLKASLPVWNEAKIWFLFASTFTQAEKKQLLKQQSRPSITYSDFSMHGECRFFTWFNSFSAELDLTWCCLFIGPIHSYHMDLFVTWMQVKVRSAACKSKVGGVNPFRVKWLWISI